MPPSYNAPMSSCRRAVVSLVFLAATTLSLSSCLSAQLVELRDYHGKQISCVQSGLRSFAMPCGSSGGYDYVFVGLVLSGTEIADDEKQLVLVPEEVFRGGPISELTVTTNQGKCLPEILPGERWLFYLRRDTQTNALLLAYGSPSELLAEAQKDVAMLRRQAQMSGFGIVKGHVQRPVWDDEDNSEKFLDVANHKIIATRVRNGTKYTALTDNNGSYEFEPLPSGEYDLSANTVKGLWSEEGRTDVHSHSCSYVEFELHPDGMISGHIRNARGKPFKDAYVEVIPASTDGGGGATADKNGYFEVRGLRPGRYLVGVNIAPQLPGELLVYYPGVWKKDLAGIIEIGQAEKRTNLDFQIPAK